MKSIIFAAVFAFAGFSAAIPAYHQYKPAPYHYKPEPTVIPYHHKPEPYHPKPYHPAPVYHHAPSYQKKYYGKRQEVPAVGSDVVPEVPAVGDSSVVPSSTLPSTDEVVPETGSIA